MNITWRDFVVMEQLPEIYRAIADAIGLGAMIRLAEGCQKMHLYLKRLPGDIDRDKLSEDYRIVAGIIGWDDTLVLAQYLPGETFYLKGVDVVFIEAKKAYIRAEFTGANHRRLAMETGLSQVYVYETLRAPGWKQLGLFDQAV